MTIGLPTSTLVKTMCKEASPYRHFNVDILDFAHHVWGLDRATGQSILAMNIKLDPRNLYAYRRSKDERELRAPFIEFAMHLLSEVASRLDVPAERASDYSCDVAYTEDISDTPTMVTTWGTCHAPNDRDTDLCIAKHILEFNHHEFKDSGAFLSQRRRSRLKHTFTSGSNLLPKPKVTRGHLAKSDPRFEAGICPPHPHGTVDLRSRKRPHDSDSSSDPSRPAKRARFDQRPQLSSLATECLAATPRRWVTGLFVDTCEVTACYFDRHMVACSSSFRFDQQPTVLAMILYAMNTCTKDHAGFDPHLLPFSLAPGAPDIGQHDSALPVSQVIGSVFDFSIAAKGDDSVDEDCIQKRTPKSEDFCKRDDGEGSDGGHTTVEDNQDVEGRREAATAQGLDNKRQGHGNGEEEPQEQSNITPGCNERDAEGTRRPSVPNATRFRVVKSIRKPDNLVSRGTTVFKVRRQLPSGDFSNNFYALKLSWPPATRVSEIDVVKHLESVVPESSHDHLPRLIFSRTWTAEQLGLPWLGLNLTLTKYNHEERVLRALASRHYEKLWEAGSIENFKQAWLDCVEVCYLAYRTGKVLHRDISENNLMVLSSPDGTVKGVLNDWDMAKFIRDRDQHIPCRYGTGTPPFMAIDLLHPAAVNPPKNGPPPSSPPHWFRHDLESLIYVLIWAALHYNLATRERDTKVNPVVKAWTKDASFNLASKFAFFNGGKRAEDYILDKVKPGFEGVAKDWIKPLRRLFKKAMYVGSEAEDDGLEGYDPSTYGGELTFKTFMKAIDVTPRTWGIPNFLECSP